VLGVSVEQGERVPSVGPPPTAEKALAEAPIFRRLAPEGIQALAGRMRARSYGRNEVVFRQGDPPGPLHLIVSGSVKVLATSDDGREAVLALLGAGSCFGEMAAIDGVERSATAVAAEPLQTLSLGRDDLEALVTASPSVAVDIIITLASRLRRSDQRLEDASFFDLDTRLARLLYDFIGERGERGPDGAIHVRVPLTQADLAGMLGATRVTVNRLLGAFQDMGMVRLERGGFAVLDERALRERARR
jgi:CRP/FNR family transcriptional regulator